MSKIDNPFLKPSPFGTQLSHPFKHPAAYPRPPTDYALIIEGHNSDHLTSLTLENNWVFN